MREKKKKMPFIKISSNRREGPEQSKLMEKKNKKVKFQNDDHMSQSKCTPYPSIHSNVRDAGEIRDFLLF